MAFLISLLARFSTPVVACASLVAFLCVAVQTVRLDGLHVFGLTLASGARDREAALRDAIDRPSTGWRARLVAAQSDVRTCGDAVTRQNAAFAQWKAESDKRNAAAAAALATARAAMRTAQARAGSILNRPPPRGVTALYHAADALIVEGARP